MNTNPFTRRLVSESITKTGRMMAIFFILILLTVSCQAARSDPATPPPDALFLAEVDLSAQSYEAETVGQFTVAETAVITIFYTLPDANTPYFDLTLNGEAADSLRILHSENYRTDQNGGGQWEKSLEPGQYDLVLTATSGSGVLSIYLMNPSEDTQVERTND